MPIGIPIANSLRTSRRRTTAVTQTATVTQNKKTGNQPETIEMPATFTEAARATAATATAAAATAARTRRRRRGRGRDGPVVCWLVVSVWVLMVDVSVSSSQLHRAHRPTVGWIKARVPREIP